jgi:4-hydroxyphenylpyruvate dioxygenase
LDIPRFSQSVAPDEWQIPAVRVGGSLFYLVDAATDADMWAQEFPDSTPATATG